MAMLKLRDYQETAADFLYERDRAMILASVGAGKTAIALTAMEAMLKDGHVNRWLVLAPKRVAVEVWPVEAKIWSPRTVMAVATGTPAVRRKAFASDAHVVVTNFDNIQTMTEAELRSFDGIVFDELTRLKNPSGKRFKSLEKKIEHIGIRWGLTGSFTSNGLEDVFGQCKVIDRGILGRSKGAFMQQYFVLINRDYGQWAPRPGSFALVMDKIKPHTFLLESKEYKDTLPPLHTIRSECVFSSNEPYIKMKRDFVVDLGGEQITAMSAASLTSKCQQMSSGFAYRTDHTPGVRKLITTKTPVWFSTHKFDRLQEIIEENQHANTIIFYQFIEELEELKRRYPNVQTLDSPGAVSRWNEGKIELLAAHPKSAGHGLNLQYGGNKIIFLSLPWSLELYEQAIGRLHRSGQKHDVWVYVLMTKDTIDDRIFSALTNKRAISDIAVDELK